MKPHKIFLFLLSVFILITAIWFFFPSEGVKAGPLRLRFPNFESSLADIENEAAEVDVDSVLRYVQKSYEMDEGSRDTLDYYYNYLTTNPNRIYLPNGDFTFFDSLFAGLGGSDTTGKVIRILHYGDSQLEMDRISAILRQELQERFGGSGPGMVPMIQKIPTVSISQSAGGNLTRFALVGDSLTRRAQHHRYGPLAQYASVSGTGTFTFSKTRNRYSQELVKRVTKVSVLLGRNSPGFAMTLKCDTLKPMGMVLDSARSGVTKVSWTLPSEVERGSITFNGNAEIYGVMLDGQNGVAVDNVALRGCAGTIFSTIDKPVMEESLDRSDTRLVILQFGGNAMPGIGSRKSISKYIEKIVREFTYFRQVAPQAQLMFIGPADMCKSVNGNLVTWPLLPDLNDSLRVNCLKQGVAYWDTFNVMGGPGSMRRWVNHSPALAGPDYIHFTSLGANEIGDALARSFLLYDDFYRLRRILSDERVRGYMNSRKAEETTGREPAELML